MNGSFQPPRPATDAFTVEDRGRIAGALHSVRLHFRRCGYAPSAAFEAGESAGLVILLNGASSTGKTSLADALRATCPERALLVMSIDSFLAERTPHKGNVELTLARTGLPLVEAFHEEIAAAARCGGRVAVDHVIGEKPEWLQDLKRRLGRLPLFTVKVHCRLDVQRRREAGRRDRAEDWPRAFRQAGRIHDGMTYDAEADTSEQDPVQLAKMLWEQMAAWRTKNGLA